MTEIFKPIKGYEDLYEVSDLGNVRNKASGKLLKPRKNRRGYLRVVLYKGDGTHKEYLIHRLVAKAFLPNPLNLLEVNHKDFNKLNNSVDNLEWCSRQYNAEYSLSKPVNQFSLDGRLLNTYKSTMDAQRQTGIPNQNISECCNGGRYKSAGGFIWKFV